MRYKSMSEEQVLDSELDTEQNEEQVEDNQEETQDVDYKAEAAKWKAIAQRNKKKAAKAPRAEDPKNINNQSNPDDKRIERLELKLEGYDDKVIDEIMELGGKEFLSKEIGKKAVEQLNEQYKAEKAAKIESSSKSEFENKYSKADLADMSAEELAKILPKTD